MNKCPICKDYEPVDEEDFQNHFRWVHVSQKDFGPENEAVPHVMAAMLAGWLTPDEAGAYVTEYLDRGMTKAERLRYRLPYALLFCSGFLFGTVVGELLGGTTVYLQFAADGLIFAAFIFAVIRGKRTGQDRQSQARGRAPRLWRRKRSRRASP